MEFNESSVESVTKLGLQDPATTRPSVSSLINRREVMIVDGGLLLLNTPIGFRWAQSQMLYQLLLKGGQTNIQTTYLILS